MPRTILLILMIQAATVQASEPVPAWIIRVPEATRTVFIAETGTAAFHRFDRVGEGVAKAGQDYMSIGLGGTGKTRPGDQRTPLGIYFVTEQLDTTKLHEKYGVTAFPLDYPNAWDRRHGRSGDGIWVHGVDPRGGERPKRDTDGCIALPNERLLALEGAFEANITPVIIGETIEWVDEVEVEAMRSSLEGAVSRWADALEQGDMVTWLDFYAADFERWGMNREEWVAFSLQTIAKRPITEVAFSDLLLLGHPVEENLYFSRFHLEVVEGETRKVISMRRMYWRRSESGALKIVAEDGG
jgi:murein L,D-transpeptidase YafK